MDKTKRVKNYFNLMDRGKEREAVHLRHKRKRKKNDVDQMNKKKICQLDG